MQSFQLKGKLLNQDITQCPEVILTITACFRIEFLNGLNGALTYHMRNCGAYLPYIDSEYDKAMAKRMYYGEELYAKLKQIKQRVDPKNVFANPHSIEP